MLAPGWAELGPDESSESERQARRAQLARWKWVHCDLASPSVDPELDLVPLTLTITRTLTLTLTLTITITLTITLKLLPNANPKP